MRKQCKSCQQWKPYQQCKPCQQCEPCQQGKPCQQWKPCERCKQLIAWYYLHLWWYFFYFDTSRLLGEPHSAYPRHNLPPLTSIIQVLSFRFQSCVRFRFGFRTLNMSFGRFTSVLTLQCIDTSSLPPLWLRRSSKRHWKTYQIF